MDGRSDQESVVRTEQSGIAKEHPSKGSRDDNESSIIAAICLGERSLFHDLIRPHEKAAYRVAYYLLRDEADAEDAVLHAFVSAFRELGTFRMGSSFSAWLMSIVLSQVETQLRKNNRMHIYSSGTPRLGKASSIIPTEVEGQTARMVLKETFQTDLCPQQAIPKIVT
jgi:RNA polymerase sigma factor (sigma-70 family)